MKCLWPVFSTIWPPTPDIARRGSLVTWRSFAAEKTTNAQKRRRKICRVPRSDAHILGDEKSGISMIYVLSKSFFCDFRRNELSAPCLLRISKARPGYTRQKHCRKVTEILYIKKKKSIPPENPVIIFRTRSKATGWVPAGKVDRAEVVRRPSTEVSAQKVISFASARWGVEP